VLWTRCADDTFFYEHEKAFYEEMDRTLARGEIWRGEICNRKKNGELYWEEKTITPI
jgi:hypothetical protein